MKLIMIKSLLACALVAGCALPARGADLVFDNPDNHPYFGARIGIDITSAANGGAYYSNKAGFSVGAVYNIPVFMNLYFEPGLSLFYDTFGTMYFKEFKIPQPLDPVVVGGETGDKYDTGIYQIDGYVSNMGFRVPLNFGYHFDLTEDVSVHVFTGPQLNWGFSARYHQNSYIDPENSRPMPSEAYSIFGTGGFKHFDLQWNYGAGATYGNYFVACTGSIGLTRMCDRTDFFKKDIRRSLFTITLGYNF